MTKLNNQQIDTAIDETDIWLEEYDHETDRYWTDYWDDVHQGEMSWQWYMGAMHHRAKGWKYVIINPNHKMQTVTNWLNVNYPDCHYRTERNHILIEDEQAAIMVALKWA